VTPSDPGFVARQYGSTANLDARASLRAGLFVARRPR
jgi:hypothetical protein